MTCPLRSFPLFNFTTIIMRGVAVLFPTLEAKFKDISVFFHDKPHKHTSSK